MLHSLAAFFPAVRPGAGACVWRAGCSMAGACVLLVAGLLVPVLAKAQEARPLGLWAAAGVVDAWPAVTVLADPEAALDLQSVRQRLTDFTPPHTPHANLGGRHGATWMRVPVTVKSGEDERWVLAIDSPLLESVEVHVVGTAGDVQSHLMGNLIPFSQRVFPTRTQAVVLKLQPERTYDVLVRVHATKTIVPLSFHSPLQFHDAATREQLVQGVMAGLGLCLALYAMAQWFVLREAMFLTYAVYVSGLTLLAYSYFGLGAQHLWGDEVWLSVHMPLLAAYATHFGMALFTEQALSVRLWNRALSLGLSAQRVLSVGAVAGYVPGAISPEVGAAVLCVASPMLVLMAAAGAILRMRAGDRGAGFLVMGWASYAAGMVVFVLMYQGCLAANYWTQHSLQFFSLGQLAMWMVVLGVRMEEMRAAALATRLERDAMHSMAHTDPLTGLLNRRALSAGLDRALRGAAADHMVGVYLLDLDGFKAVNDQWGHDAGDALLVGVAQRLKSMVRASDMVARLGGDEFVVVAAQLPSDAEAHRFGMKLLEGIVAPFDAAGRPCKVRVTIGYVLAPQDGAAAAPLLKLADDGLYEGKRGGRHCLRRGAAVSPDAAAEL